VVLSLTKVMAKVGSKHRKPDGLTVIPGRAIASYLQDLQMEKIWSIGPATTDADYLFAQLLRNLESACLKARRYKLAPRRLAFF